MVLNVDQRQYGTAAPCYPPFISWHL